jgi:hypothetical protein
MGFRCAATKKQSRLGLACHCHCYAAMPAFHGDSSTRLLLLPMIWIAGSDPRSWSLEQHAAASLRALFCSFVCFPQLQASAFSSGTKTNSTTPPQLCKTGAYPDMTIVLKMQHLFR